MKLEHIEQTLREKGYKLTKQRKTLIEVFLENISKLLSAEDIREKVNLKFPGTNFSTIYRNLDLFVLCGILQRVNMNGASSMFKLADDAGNTHSDSHHHRHLMICKDCGQTEPLDFCPMDAIMDKMKSDDFVLTDHKLELYGYCKKCNKKESNE